MYSADMAVSQKLADMKKEINWPLGIILTTGKEKIDKVFEAIEPLKDIMVPSMAAQSMDLDTLNTIDRTNLAEKTYKKYADDAADKDLALFAELILSMPKETLETYWSGVKSLIGMGVNKMSTYTLQLNYGTVYRVSSYMKEHEYVGKFRMIPNAYGMYDGDRVFDVEMVGVANKYMTFDEYLECRKLALYVELVYNSDCFAELLKYWKECGFEIADYLEAIRGGMNAAPENVKKIIDSFVHDTELELYDTEEELYAYFSDPEIYDKLSKGEIGGNVIFKHKVLMYSEYVDDLISFVVSCTKSFLKKSSTYVYTDDDDRIFDNLQSYLLAKYSGIIDANTIHETPFFEGDYDIWAWNNDKDGPPLKSFKKEVVYNMSYSEEQKQMLEEMFGIYGNTIVGKIKVISKVMKWQNLVHFPQTYDAVQSKSLVGIC
jgi:hypothetical protein